MMRILLASGEEAVYRTVEELAMGISSGTITGDARFFDSRSQDWRAIEAHPVYREALTRAATIAPGELESHPVASAVIPVVPALQPDRDRSFQIYQMFSLSAAELQAKKRPAWLLPGFAGLAALTLVISLVLVLRGRSPHLAGAEEVAPLSIGVVPVYGTPTLPAHSSVEAMRLAPMNLNSHLTFAMEVAGRRLNDSLDAIGARALLSRGRQLSADSVRRTREILVTVRSLVSNYRTAQRHAVQAYRDTAAMLTKSGFWSKIDQQEWKVYPSAAESPSDAAQADSLLNYLEQLYDLLDEQPRAYRDVGGNIQFDDSASGLQYDRLQAQLNRFGSSEDFSDSKPTALTVLRKVARPTASTARSSRSLP